MVPPQKSLLFPTLTWCDPEIVVEQTVDPRWFGTPCRLWSHCCHEISPKPHKLSRFSDTAFTIHWHFTPCDMTSWHRPLTRYEKLRVAHAPGMSGTFSPPLPTCMSGLLTSGFLWSRWRGKLSRHSRRMPNPQFYVSGKRPSETLFALQMNCDWKCHDCRACDVSVVVRHHLPILEHSTMWSPS